MMACTLHRRQCCLLITAKCILSSNRCFQSLNSIAMSTCNNQSTKWHNIQIKINHIYTSSKFKCLSKECKTNSCKINTNHKCKTNGFNNQTKDLQPCRWRNLQEAETNIKFQFIIKTLNNQYSNQCNNQCTTKQQRLPHFWQLLLLDNAPRCLMLNLAKLI